MPFASRLVPLSIHRKLMAALRGRVRLRGARPTRARANGSTPTRQRLPELELAGGFPSGVSGLALRLRAGANPPNHLCSVRERKRRHG